MANKKLFLLNYESRAEVTHINRLCVEGQRKVHFDDVELGKVEISFAKAIRHNDANQSVSGYEEIGCARESFQS